MKPARTKWEHEIVGDFEEVVKLGKIGWQLVAVVPHHGEFETDNCNYFLKREGE